MPNRVLTPVTELDFDGIKQNLKNYLSTTTEFSDYDYEGAGINVLLDLLAYNTHYTAMYANMLAAESFIDSAVMRKSLVSLAKNLGYIPNSRNAATAVVNLTFGTTAGVPSIVPTGTNFTATKNGVNYTFTVVEPVSIDKTTTPYKANNITIRQGQYKTASFIYDADTNSTKFEIPFNGIDKKLMRVYVMKSAVDLSNADVNWVENTDYISLTSSSKVYFITENHKGNYQISFGDGILGAAPEKGNYILVVFFQTDGEDGNNIGNSDGDGESSFVFSGILGNNYEAVVTTVSSSAGGAERDNEEAIRYTAPKYYQSQDRAVTANDYESIILSEYPAAGAVRIWGGEENNPPEHGKVFISVLPKNSRILSDSQKQQIIQSIINKKKVVAVTAEVVDPDFTYIFLECFATYNSLNAFTNEMDVRDSISSAIRSYSRDGLQTFGNPFRYSLLSRKIDLTANTIVSNRLSTRLMKKVIPLPGQGNYSMDFGTPLFHPYDGNGSIVSTSQFPHRDSGNLVRSCFLEDDGYGKISMFTLINGVKTLVFDRIGTMDYQTGTVSLVGFNPTGTGSLPYIKFIVTPDQRFDLVPKRNQILTIDTTIPESITINLQDSAIRNI
jgi:hypothetical protein